MGVFGDGPFDNDDAVDWLGELDSLESVEAALALEKGERFYEIDEVSEAYAAAGVVAALLEGVRGLVPARLFKHLTAAFASTPPTTRATLIAAAISATKVATASRASELRQLANRRTLERAGARLITTLTKHHRRLAVDPKRPPKGIGRGARFDRESNAWLTGPRDAKGRDHGVICIWRADGTLQQRCEFVHGTPHGAYTRYHESGEVSRTGFLSKNVLDGLDVIYRPKSPSSDDLLKNAYPASIWRLETVFLHGLSVTQRYFGAKGEQLTVTGQPLPRRPRTVPATAIFADGQWSAGRLDARGLPDGTWRSWNRKGTPTHDIEFSAGVEQSRTVHRARR